MFVCMDRSVLQYLSAIGRRGGRKSRGQLDAETARSMVKVREARRAFRDFHAQCFWSCDPDYQVGLNDVPWVAEQLMRHGGPWLGVRGTPVPLTPYQAAIARLLSSNRTPDSYLAGGAALNIEPNSKRFSNDLDYFQDSEERVASAYAEDRSTLGRGICGEGCDATARVHTGGGRAKWRARGSLARLPPSTARHRQGQAMPIQLLGKLSHTGPLRRMNEQRETRTELHDLPGCEGIAGLRRLHGSAQ